MTILNCYNRRIWGKLAFLVSGGGVINGGRMWNMASQWLFTLPCEEVEQKTNTFGKRTCIIRVCLVYALDSEYMHQVFSLYFYGIPHLNVYDYLTSLYVMFYVYCLYYGDVIFVTFLMKFILLSVAWEVALGACIVDV